jgi:hypothetical protein
MGKPSLRHGGRAEDGVDIGARPGREVVVERDASERGDERALQFGGGGVEAIIPPRRRGAAPEEARQREAWRW